MNPALEAVEAHLLRHSIVRFQDFKDLLGKFLSIFVSLYREPSCESLVLPVYHSTLLIDWCALPN